MSRAWKVVFFCAVYLPAIVLGINYVLYRRCLREIPMPDQAWYGFSPACKQGLDAKKMARIGWLSDEKASRFTRFERKKDEGVLRIGCFGDSFTEGAEVNSGKDYPALLQNLFRHNGYRNVEVINFGEGAHGFHQAYMIWDYIGRHYNLDYVFFFSHLASAVERDSSFNSGFNGGYTLHARYILTNEGVSLLDTIDNHGAKRASRYYGFIPSWRYLRYDARPPALISSWLPKGKTLPNPFYYYPGDTREEMEKTYAVLLEKVVAQGVPVVIAQVEDSPIDLKKMLGGVKNVFPLKVSINPSFPNRMPNGHYSGVGNLTLAKQIFQYLTKGSVCRTAELEFTLCPESNKRPYPDILSCDDVAVELSSGAVARFYGLRGQTGPFFRPTSKFDSKKPGFLLAFRDKSRTLLDALFVDFEGPIEKNAPVSLREGFGGTEHPLGFVNFPVNGLNLAVAEIEGFYADVRFWRRGTDGFDFSPGKKLEELLPDFGHVTIMVAGKPVLEIRKNGFIRIISPVQRNLFTINLEPDAIFDPDSSARKGTVDLVLRNGSLLTRVPLATWQRTHKIVDLAVDTGASHDSGLHPPFFPKNRKAPQEASGKQLQVDSRGSIVWFPIKEMTAMSSE